MSAKLQGGFFALHCMLGNLGRKFVVDAINDFFNIKGLCDMTMWRVKVRNFAGDRVSHDTSDCMQSSKPR